MKKSFICLTLLAASSSVFAETEYPQNPVLRPLTLTDGTISVSGTVAIAEENNDNRGEVNLNAAYGVTDNLTIGLAGIDYRVLAREDNDTGLELALGLGIRGYQESTLNGDAVGYGVDLKGKYVFNQDIAMLFSAGYVKWDEEKLQNKDEYRYSLGVQGNLAKDWTANVMYTYRDLKDFKQNEAHQASLGLNYAFSKNIDMGVFVGYSNFDAQQNDYDFDNSFERAAGFYGTYRF